MGTTVCQNCGCDNIEVLNTTNRHQRQLVNEIDGDATIETQSFINNNNTTKHVHQTQRKQSNNADFCSPLMDTDYNITQGEPIKKKKVNVTTNDSSSSDSDLEASISPLDDTDNIQYSTSNLSEIDMAKDGWCKAIDAGNDSLANYFLQEYTEIDLLKHKWNNGDTALHIACKNAKPQLVFFLLTKGANINELNNKNNCTAMHYAIETKHLKIIETLLNWNPDLNVMNISNETPKDIAYKFMNSEIYEMLIKYQEKLQKNDNNLIMNSNKNDDDNKDGNNDNKDNNSCKITQMHFKINLDEKEKKKNNQKSRRHSQQILDRIRIERLRGGMVRGLKRVDSATALAAIKKELPQLPKMEGWLLKQKPGVITDWVATQYQKRWIVVKGCHLLWNDKQRIIKNDANRKERKKFNGSIHLMTVASILPFTSGSDSNKKFMIKAKDEKDNFKMRKYVFKTNCKKDRDWWILGIKQYQKQYQQIRHYLGK